MAIRAAYSEHAAAIGHPPRCGQSARQWRQPDSILVPCHRLIGKDGSLVKYGGGLDTSAGC